MTFIIGGIIIVYLLVIAWTWSSLEELEKKSKIMIIFAGIIAIFLFLVIFG